MVIARPVVFGDRIGRQGSFSEFEQARVCHAVVTIHQPSKVDELAGCVVSMSLVRSARLVTTDSGGIQEKTTHVGTPCLTFRMNAERSGTVTHGRHRLCTPLEPVSRLALQVLSERDPPRRSIEFRGGVSAERDVKEFDRN